MNMPEYMRIRQYLYNLVEKADEKALQIPPESELASLFNVSRITVRGAIKGLVKEKFLIPKRGMGTFINPITLDRASRRLPTVGLLVGGGRHSAGPFDPLTAKCAQIAGMNFETIYMPESESPERLLETVKSGVDAIIWMHYDRGPVKHLAHLAANGVAVLSVNIEDSALEKDFDCIASGKERRGATLAEFLFKRGHRNMLLLHNFGPAHTKRMLSKGSTHFRYCERMEELCAAAGGQKPRAEALALADFERALKNGDERLKGATAIYALAEVAPFAMKALKEANLSVPKDFSFLCYGDSDARFFDGLEPAHFDIEAPVREAVLEWLDLRLVKGERGGRFAKHIDIGIIPGQTVKDIGKEAGI